MASRSLVWPRLQNLAVPDHREVVKDILQKLIREAGLTVDEFFELL